MQKVDTVRAFETPEGVDLQLRLAGPVVRAMAWGVDMLIRSVVYTAMVLVFSLLDIFGMGLMLIGIFLVEWFYPVFFELRSGQTPGKKTMKIKVVNDNGTPVSTYASVIRNLLRAVDFLPTAYGLGLVAMVVNRDFKRLGDLAAGTLVVYVEKQAERKPLPEAPPLPPPVSLSFEEQRAILDFAERRESISSARVEELAELLSGMSGREGEAAVAVMLGYANWVVQGR